MVVVSDHDVIVVGGGLAGLTAAMFSARRGHSTLVLAAGVPGGQLLTVERVEDFPGFPDGIAGFDLGPLVQEQAAGQGVEFLAAKAESLEAAGAYWLVTAGKQKHRTKAVVIAAGSHPKKLGVPGESRLWGKGVSNCATCDGPFFQGKVVGVVGGGDSALQEALTLANHGCEVVILHRGAELSGQWVYQQRVFAHPRIDVRYNTVVEEILGDEAVTGARLRDVVTGEEDEIGLSAVFVYVGSEPNTGFLEGLMRLDSAGRIPTDRWMRTELDGIFAAGDICQDSPAQAITSAGEGAVAAMAAHSYIARHMWPEL